jgi:hypothetical protein
MRVAEKLDWKGLTPSIWLRYITQTPTYSIISYGNIICDVLSTFHEHKLKRETRALCKCTFIYTRVGQKISLKFMPFSAK